MTHLMNTYARLPIAFERGQGVWLWDTQGKRYLDALCGIAVTGIGHAHSPPSRTAPAMTTSMWRALATPRPIT